ncbi:MAG: extracellular solute-binding protein [Actinomycetota bacterium]|nr:extracellular solute-binding protein [Actinomycetota bacterium]
MNRTLSASAALTLVATLSLALSGCGGGGGFDGESAAPEQEQTGPVELQVLIGSSGPAETDAVTAAADAWAEESGNTAEVVAAQDLNQQLSQGFAAGSPPDVFYVSSDLVASYAANGSIEPYAAEMENADDFYPNLRAAFTVDDTYYCAPKDFSTLALVINTDSWTAAGLTDADVPTTWEELSAVAEKLTTDTQVGLTTSTEYQRLGAFMAQAGGGLVSDGTATADSAENVEALNYVKSMLDAGTMKFSPDLDAGWAGEAFGTGKAAMTIEGNWMIGALAADYPDVTAQFAPLPEGPAGPGTLTFTNCWGIAADSQNKEAARQLVEFLTSSDQQLAFADAFGVMPSVQSAADPWRAANPEAAAFLDQADYAVAIPNNEGISDVVADLNAQLESLATTGDPQTILDSAQSNLEPLLGS